ncbi:hypothetical protein HOF65_04430 [bacterium]|nr:hypothetical protein [bacterium]
MNVIDLLPIRENGSFTLAHSGALTICILAHISFKLLLNCHILILNSSAFLNNLSYPNISRIFNLC